MKIRKIILFPLALLYGLIVWIRNRLYDLGFFKTHTFDFPVICVGNLSTGGTGKTPHVEYLIKLLHQNGYKPGVLSRGYGRERRGYVEVKRNHTAYDVGDEPCQMKQKFPGVVIAVTRRRVYGIRKLLTDHPNIDVILLDDGYQHRSVKAGLNILLTEYTSLFSQQMLLPAGRLREPMSESRRADIFMITKCPNVYSPIEHRRLKEALNPAEKQQMYMSYITYNDPVKYDPEGIDVDIMPFSSEMKIILFTGIANPIPLKNQIMRYCKEFQCIEFRDHHYYTEKDLKNVIKAKESLPPTNRMVLTTEKDIYRIHGTSLAGEFAKIPVYYIQMKTVVHKIPGAKSFDEQILDYVKKN